MDLQPGVGELLTGFGEEIRPVVGLVALYVGGSLASGDYRAGVSDIDLVAVVERPLSRRQWTSLRRIHRRLVARKPVAAKLHCVYLPFGELAEVGIGHVTWTGRTLVRRPLSGVARAEVRLRGFVVFGSRPDTVIPAMSAAELRDAVRRELTGYWSSALQRRWIWLRDFDVDLSLLTLARAEATLSEGRLITKREALTRLDRFNIPPDLTDEIGKRRDGHSVSISVTGRLRRAITVHRIVSDGIASLLST